MERKFNSCEEEKQFAKKSYTINNVFELRDESL